MKYKMRVQYLDNNVYDEWEIINNYCEYESAKPITARDLLNYLDNYLDDHLIRRLLYEGNEIKNNDMVIDNSNL